MRLRVLKVGCFGGGTGLPSLLGGLKHNPWVDLHAIVTMFDSGGSSGQLRDELGVLPPGDVLKCALALARNEREAREILLARLPMLEHGRLAGHTGGNLLLSMMEQYTGDFLAAVDGLRALLGCRGHVWPITVERATLCAEYADGSTTRGEVEVDAGQAGGRRDRPAVARPAGVRFTRASPRRSARSTPSSSGPAASTRACCRSFSWTACREALAEVKGPVIYIANLLTEGRGHGGLHRRRRRPRVWPRPSAGRLTCVVFNIGAPNDDVLARYAREHKAPLPLGDVAGRLSGDRRRVLARPDRAPRPRAAARRRLGGAGGSTADE